LFASEVILLRTLYFKLLSKLIFQKVLGAFKCFLKTKCPKLSKKLSITIGEVTLAERVERAVLRTLKSCTRSK
jgi:hypothetical protein